MKLKQYIKHGAIVAALSATTIFAATAWPTTAGIENGQIIQAPTIRDGLQYLYERSWDFLGGTDENYIATNLSVAAPEYCDENGENCFTGAQIINIFNSTTTNVTTGGSRTMCEVTFDYSTHTKSGTAIRYIDAGGTSAIATWSKNDRPNFDARWSNMLVYSSWGGGLFDSASRSAVGYYDADKYAEQFSWLSQGHEPTMRYATFEAEEGASASVTSSRRGTHTLSVEVGVCQPMNRPPLFAWNRTAWSSCTTPVGYRTVITPADKGRQETTRQVPILPSDQSRVVSCRNASGATVGDEYCPTDKPAARQQCYRCTGKALEMGACENRVSGDRL